MPSLIYIARIKSLSEELATGLQSAGCHVKSFKPGDITQDECLLVMTSEAVGATPDPQGHKAETGRTVAGTPVAPDMNEQLGSQAANWNRIKTAVTKESQAKREQVAAVASTEQPEAIKLDFTPTEVERRTVSKAQNRAIGESAPIEPFRIIAVSSAAAVSRILKNVRPTKERLCRVFRNPLSTVVAVLLFSVVYRGLMLASRKGMTIPRQVSYDTRANYDSANSLLNVSASPGRTAHRSIPPLTLSSAEPPPQAVRVQRHLSHDDYVAEDFTNRVGLRAQGSATQQNPELKHPQSGSIRKRIVLN
jgi:hypothetical protein